MKFVCCRPFQGLKRGKEFIQQYFFQKARFRLYQELDVISIIKTIQQQHLLS
jgi:hypothetical protein